MPNRLRELAAVFLRLGASAFGGPAAHVGFMEHEVVARRAWITRAAFVDLIGAVNLIPGPNSTEIAIHVGYARGGWRGLIVAGVSFIAPAALMVTVLAWAYVRYGSLPSIAAVLYGVKPVVVAVIVHALWRLARTALRGPLTLSVAVASVLAVVAGVHELIVLGGAALVCAGGAGVRRLLTAVLAIAGSARVDAQPAQQVIGVTAAGVAAVGLWPLFGVFLKIGSVLFGSGYVLLAFLRADLIERHHWLTERQLLDAVAVGQITPGPLSTTATFIGYLLAGLPGAAVATIGIFLPAFVFVAISGPVLPRLRQNAVAASVLDGVNAASLALMAVVTWHLGRAALVDPLTVALALATAVLLATGISSVWLVGAGAAAGWLARTL
jgi:chromate transporter